MRRRGGREVLEGRPVVHHASHADQRNGSLRALRVSACCGFLLLAFLFGFFLRQRGNAFAIDLRLTLHFGRRLLGRLGWFGLRLGLLRFRFRRLRFWRLRFRCGLAWPAAAVACHGQ